MFLCRGGSYILLMESFLHFSELRSWNLLTRTDRGYHFIRLVVRQAMEKKYMKLLFMLLNPETMDIENCELLHTDI